MRKLLIVLMSLVVFGGVFAIWMGFRVREVIHDSYAVWWVADMVVEHLKATEDQWPKDWDELRDDYRTVVKRSGDAWSFEELSSRVCVDWTASVAELRKSALEGDKPNFRVIWLRDERTSHWAGAEPNQIIYDYLMKRSRRSDQ